MAADEQPLDCVIASSDRYNDVGPYCNRLYAEDSTRWGDILPWDFPQDPTKEEEEAFLRQFFTDREIHMQGGAFGNGNGFRFLKQVWWTIALYNWQTRVPALSDWWFMHNQDLLKDDNLMKHMLNPDVLPSTFFQERELRMYGGNFLKCTIKVIQWKLKHPEDLQASCADDMASAADSLAGGSSQTNEAKSQSQAITKGPHSTDKQIPPTPASAPVAFQPNAKMFTPELASVTPIANAGNSSLQPRSFSGETYSTQDIRSQAPRKRSSSDKRQSFATGFRPTESRDQNYQPKPMSHPVPNPAFGPAAGYGPPPPQNRGPSYGSLLKPHEYMPGLPQGQQANLPPPPPGLIQGGPAPGYPPPFAPDHQAMNPGPYPGMIPEYYNSAQPFADRSNGQFAARNFSNEMPFGKMDGRIDHTQKQRHDSMSSRGSKRGGFNVPGRGRGSRGRNSNGQGGGSIDGMGPHRKQNSDFYNPGFGFQPKDMQPHDQPTDKNWRSHVASNRDENRFPRGDARASPDFNRPYVPASMQHGSPFSQQSSIPPHGQVPPSSVPYRASSSVNDRGSHGSFGTSHQPCADDGCTLFEIGQNCDHVNKLVLFAVPEDVGEAALVGYFQSFGPITAVSSRHGYSDGVLNVFMTFASAASARECLKNGTNNPWKCRMQVAREFLVQSPQDSRPSYARGQRNTSVGYQSQPLAPFQVPASNMPLPSRSDVASADSTPRATNVSSAAMESEFASGDTTPTASGPGTPRQKPKRKKPKKTNLREESLARAFVENAQKRRVVISPVPQDSSNESDVVFSRAGSENRADTPLYDDTTEDGTSPDAESTKSDPSNISEGKDPVVKSVTAISHATKALQHPPHMAGAQDATSLASEKGSPPQIAASAGVQRGEEPAEESFHAADGISEEGQSATSSEIEPSPIAKQEQDTGGSAHSDLGSHPDKEVEHATAAKLEGKKAPIPQMPSKTKAVKIALPPIDTGKADSQSLDNKPEGTVQQRTASGESGPPSSSFVTAPNTPAIQESGPQEPQSKKGAKPKGPAETESFSQFRKVSKSKKSKQLSKPKIKSADSQFLDAATQPITDSATPSASPKQQQAQHDAQQSVYETDTGMGNQAEEPTITAGVLAAPNDAGLTGEHVASPLRDSFFNRVGSIIRSNFLKQEQSKKSETEDFAHEAHPDVEAESAGVSQVSGHGETDVVETTEPTTHEEEAKKGKTKKSKKSKKKSSTPVPDATADEKPNDGQTPLTVMPKADILEMSHPLRINEPGKPVFEFKGSDAASEDSSRPSSASPSSSRKMVPRQAGHLLVAEPKRVRQNHSRSASGKSSDTLNSADEGVVALQKPTKSADNSNNMGDMREPTHEELVGLGVFDGSAGEKLDEPEEHYISEAIQESREKLRKIEEQEARKKAEKDAAGAKKDVK